MSEVRVHDCAGFDCLLWGLLGPFGFTWCICLSGLQHSHCENEAPQTSDARTSQRQLRSYKTVPVDRRSDGKIKDAFIVVGVLLVHVVHVLQVMRLNVVL